MPNQFFPWLPPGGEPSDQKLGEQGLRLGLGVGDPHPSLGQGEGQRFPSDLGSGGRLLASPNEVPYEAPDMAAHPRIRVPAGGQVPKRSKEDLVRNQDPSC
ncbi:unnamed protein product [Sphagnum troendelagicum]|uniref:Uncharacterized protein n=1 Tax=Sphagnum troendelagicum TaxID=128251 RepID=A0ABP0TC25_9BRYO